MTPALAVSSPTDLSDREWALLEPLLPPPNPGGRPRSVDLRMILMRHLRLSVTRRTPGGERDLRVEKRSLGERHAHAFVLSHPLRRALRHTHCTPPLARYFLAV